MAAPIGRGHRLQRLCRRPAVAAAAPHGLGAGPRRSAVFDLAIRVGVSQAWRRSAAALQPQHLPSAPADADLLGFDAPAGADDRSLSARRDASGDGLQPGLGAELHRFGLRDVSAGRATDRIARGRVRGWASLWLLSVSLRALQPLRAADDVLHAAGATGAPPVCHERADQGRGAVWRTCRRAALLLDVLRGLFYDLCCRAFCGPLRPDASAARAHARPGRARRLSRARARAASRRAPTAPRSLAIATRRPSRTTARRPRTTFVPIRGAPRGESARCLAGCPSAHSFPV